MALRNESLQSGVSYSLYDFFSHNRIIVIPDLQRDYCWATTKPTSGHGTLVEAYVDDLISASRSAEETEKGRTPEMKMGLLYGYEYPAGNVQLCDGQQRLTTLFLMAGVCLKKLGNEDCVLKEKAINVISRGKSSRLQYAIRDSSLSFINNLVDLRAFHPGVTDEPWFSNEYRRDPSVCNMILAIKQIDTRVYDAETAKRLLDYILHNISFVYFDMQSRTYSEEQYVILNTTGYSLTPAEHVKPRLLGKLSDAHLDLYSGRWESWEQFIWKHRPKEDDNFTVDEWFDRFLTIFFLAENITANTSYSDKEAGYTQYQQVLQGTRKYTFSADTETDAIKSLEIINRYFETAKKISELDLPVTLDLGSNPIPSKSIWEYISLNAGWNNLSNLQQVVSVFIQVSRIKEHSAETIAAWSRRVLEFAWVQFQYKNENQDVCRFLSYIAGLDLEGPSIYSAACDNTLFSDGLRTKKFPLLSHVNNSSPISEMEKALQSLSHLQTSRGRISYALDIFENPQPEGLCLLAQNLAQTVDAPDALLRRALMTYGVYWYEYGWCKWGKRYEFAPNASYFYSRTHDKPDDVVLSFIKDIATKTNIKDYLRNRIETMSPASTGDSRLDKTIRLLFMHEEYFKFMHSGRIAVDEHNAYAMHGPNASGSYRTIMDPRQREMVQQTKSLLGDKWAVWDEFTLARERENIIGGTIKMWATGDWHISEEDNLEFRSYVKVECRDKEWTDTKQELIKLFPDSHFVDDKDKHLHIKVLHASSPHDAASLLQSIYDRLLGTTPTETACD